MGQPVVHFEVIGMDAQQQQSCCSGQFADPEGHLVGVVSGG